MKNFLVFLVLAIFISRAYSQRRIFSGEEAKPGTFGYVVHVQMMGKGACTGCIIHQDWVLSAAHCVVAKDDSSSVLSPRSIILTAGRVDMKTTGPDTQVRRGQFIKVHEGYRFRLGKPDLSLIKVNESFVFKGSVKKMGFFASPWPQGSGGEWKDCIAAGWGLTEEGPATHLHFLKTTAKHGKHACPCIHKIYILKRYVCLPAIADEGICFGDSGGALFCEDKIVGVAHVLTDKRSCSYSESPSKTVNCGSPHVYGIFIYTCPYLNWISQVVPGVPGTPESCTAIQIALPLFHSKLYLLLYVIFIMIT